MPRHTTAARRGDAASADSCERRPRRHPRHGRCSYPCRRPRLQAGPLQPRGDRCLWSRAIGHRPASERHRRACGRGGFREALRAGNRRRRAVPAGSPEWRSAVPASIGPLRAATRARWRARLLTFTNVTAFRASIEQAIYERGVHEGDPQHRDRSVRGPGFRAAGPVGEPRLLRHVRRLAREDTGCSAPRSGRRRVESIRALGIAQSDLFRQSRLRAD